MTSTAETSTDTQLGRKIGQVKWFNNKAGYGFITVTGDDCPSNDIFIHYSSIRVANYKYLIQGEYVEFNLDHCFETFICKSLIAEIKFIYKSSSCCIGNKSFILFLKRCIY